ncbi:MAG: PEP-CTERM sorting domain-containing protein [Chthoniobacterales bacterium]|nr:PEP-CTERM sorting domain-containing protein [Chthoniobacterales bacterium]
MKKVLLPAIAAAALTASVSAQVLIGSSSGSDYTTATWTNGATNAFNGWYITSLAGTSSSISDSVGTTGRTSIGSQAFFIVGNTNGVFIDVYAPLGGLLSSGQSISLSANYGWSDGSRGIEFTSGSALFRFEHDSGGLSLKGTGFSDLVITNNAYNTAFTYNISFVNATTVGVSASLYGGGSPLLSTNVIVSAMPSEIKFYATAGGVGAGDVQNTGIYFNNLTTVPEPSTYALLALSAAGLSGYVIRRRHR